MGYSKKYPEKEGFYMNKEQREELRKEWKTRVNDFMASGQTTNEWCTEHGIKPSQLRYWLRKYKNNEKADTPHWLPVELDSHTCSSVQNIPLLVKVGQATIEVKPGYDRELLKDLVRTLLPLC